MNKPCTELLCRKIADYLHVFMPKPSIRVLLTLNAHASGRLCKLPTNMQTLERMRSYSDYIEAIQLTGGEIETSSVKHET